MNEHWARVCLLAYNAFVLALMIGAFIYTHSAWVFLLIFALMHEREESS